MIIQVTVAVVVGPSATATGVSLPQLQLLCNSIIIKVKMIQTNGEEKYEHRRAANQLRADHDLKREKEKIFGGKKKKEGEYMACESLRERGEKHKNEKEENIPIGEHLDIKKRSLAYREMLNTGEEMKFEGSPPIDDASLDQDGP